VLALEYRFFGQQAKGGPSYALLNSGVMVHSQAPGSILKEQDWPISVEAQFLAGGRTTMNVCTPGTEIFMKGEMVKMHCVNSTSKIYGNGEWVAVEVEVLGSEHVRHLIDGRVVLEYEKPMIGGGVATGFNPAIKKDGTILEDGYIGLQAESQPVEFRNIRLLNLSGCMDQKSPAYRPYFVHRDNSGCRYGRGKSLDRRGRATSAIAEPTLCWTSRGLRGADARNRASVRSRFRLTPRARLLIGRAVVKDRKEALTELGLVTLALFGAVSD
jgi:hypothetical protein